MQQTDSNLNKSNFVNILKVFNSWYFLLKQLVLQSALKIFFYIFCKSCFILYNQIVLVESSNCSIKHKQSVNFFIVLTALCLVFYFCCILVHHQIRFNKMRDTFSSLYHTLLNKIASNLFTSNVFVFVQSQHYIFYH